MRQLGFWVAVGGVGGVLAPVVLNLAADKFPNSGFATLNHYVTRKNG